MRQWTKTYVSSFPHILAGNDYLSPSPHICRGEKNKQKQAEALCCTSFKIHSLNATYPGDTTVIPVPHAKHVNAMTLPCETSWSNQDAACQHCTVCYQTTSHHRGWESNSTQPTCITKRQKSCMIVPSKVRMMQGLFTLAKVSRLSSGAGLPHLHSALWGQMGVTLHSAPLQSRAEHSSHSVKYNTCCLEEWNTKLWSGSVGDRWHILKP